MIGEATRVNITEGKDTNARACFVRSVNLSTHYVTCVQLLQAGQCNPVSKLIYLGAAQPVQIWFPDSADILHLNSARREQASQLNRGSTPSESS